MTNEEEDCDLIVHFFGRDELTLAAYAHSHTYLCKGSYPAVVDMILVILVFLQDQFN